MIASNFCKRQRTKIKIVYIYIMNAFFYLHLRSPLRTESIIIYVLLQGYVSSHLPNGTTCIKGGILTLFNIIITLCTPDCAWRNVFDRQCPFHLHILPSFLWLMILIRFATLLFRLWCFLLHRFHHPPKSIGELSWVFSLSSTFRERCNQPLLQSMTIICNSLIIWLCGILGSFFPIV